MHRAELGVQSSLEQLALQTLITWRDYIGSSLLNELSHIKAIQLMLTVLNVVQDLLESCRNTCSKTCSSTVALVNSVASKTKPGGHRSCSQHDTVSRCSTGFSTHSLSAGPAGWKDEFSLWTSTITGGTALLLTLEHQPGPHWQAPKTDLLLLAALIAACVMI